MAERNPSPPRFSAEEKELIESDNIGDTVFSKKWVLKTLMKLVERINDDKTDQQSEDQESEVNGEDALENDHHHIDEEFDSELCELWDMSMNKDVAAFLKDVDATDVLLNSILKSKRDRITEICIGILGNMACSDDVCVEMMKNNDLVNMITAFLDDPDTPILVETTRLMHVCVSNDQVKDQWIDAVKKFSAFKNFNFILENSLNVDLLTNCSHLVDKVLDSSDELLQEWADIDLVRAVCEAMKQIKFVHIKVVEELLHVLQLVSTVEKGVQALVSCPAVVPLLCHFVGECGHDEGGIIVGRELSLMASFSVLNVILLAEPLNVLTAMEKDPRIMKILMGLLGYSCKIHRKRRSRVSFSEDKKASHFPLENETSGAENNEKFSKPSCESTVEGAVGTTPSSLLNKDDQPKNEQDQNQNSHSTRHQSQDDESNSQVDIENNIHHQYFTVAIGFLKDIISQAPIAPQIVSNMLAPHHKMLQKIIQYSKRINTYHDVVQDLVEATLSTPELSSLHDTLKQVGQTQALSSLRRPTMRQIEEAEQRQTNPTAVVTVPSSSDQSSQKQTF